MEVTHSVPSLPLQHLKRTKIIATIGPATDSYESIHGLIKAGSNGLRINFSHAKPEDADRLIPWIRKASEAVGKPVAIIQDLQGPKIRLGDFDGIVNVQKGQSLSFAYHSDYAKSGHLPTQYDLSTKVKRGERLYLFDGRIRTEVSSVQNGVVYAKAENDGILIKRKGINLPDTDFEGDIFTEKDRKDMIYGSTQDFDYVAISFVQTGDDIIAFRKKLDALGSNAKIISKVETSAAVENIEDIVRESDAVMIARGDLAVETSPESVPIVQRKIIGLGLRYAKPTIVATQMLISMTEAPEPTRAEVSDIATAVIVGADCVMLSDETAMGQYPVEAVKVMKRVIRYTEANAPVKALFPDNDNDHTRQTAISKALISLADTVQAKAIVAETLTGATALQVATRRCEIPLIAVTSNIRTAQQLAIAWGIKSYVRPVDASAAIKLTDWLYKHSVLAKGDMVVTASGRHPGVVGTTDTIKVRLLE